MHGIFLIAAWKCFHHVQWHTACESLVMKINILAVSMAAAALLTTPLSGRADDNDKEIKGSVNGKVAEAQRKAHEKICQGHHGTVTAKTDNSVTIDGKRYALTADTKVNKQEEPLLLKTVKVGDTVCYTTEKASDGSQQIAQLIAIDKNTDRVRVREKDSSGKVEVETPSKKIEVK